MAKEHYKIPAALNRSFLDHEIRMSISGLNVTTPLKKVLFIIMSLLALIWAMTSTFLGDGGVGLAILVIIWWLVATFYLARVTKTRELQIRRVGVLMAYLPRTARRIFTRKSSSPSYFAHITGIDDITESGIIRFNDGGVGRLFLVVGSASVLLFEEDRNAILDRVDSFWRKIDENTEVVFLTTQEPQRIISQVAELERRNRQLIDRDPDLVDLLDEQFDILVDYVGGRFSSIHQYLLLRGDSFEAFRRGVNLLQAEVEGSPLMIKECVQLDRTDTTAALAVLYQGVQIDPLTRLRLAAESQRAAGSSDELELSGANTVAA